MSSKAGIGHNSLTEEEKQALFMHHLRTGLALQIEHEELKARKSAFNQRLKADGFPVMRMRRALELNATDQPEKIMANMLGDLQIARWMGHDIPTDQIELFEKTAEERAFDDGKRAGMLAAAKQPPHDPSVPQYHRWMEGYEAGQDLTKAEFIKQISARAQSVDADEEVGGEEDEDEEGSDDDNRVVPLRPPHSTTHEDEGAEDAGIASTDPLGR